jgi:ribonuclease Z
MTRHQLGFSARCAAYRPGDKMKSISALAGLLLLLTGPHAVVHAQKAIAGASDPSITVVLLGTRSGPFVDAQRFGISTLVLAGPEKLLFDCGRASTTGMERLAINPADVTKVFLTHLHSDHIVSLPELVLFPWAQGRATPLQVWGPDGTKSMVKHLLEAFSFDIHIRRDVDEKFSPEGINVTANDIREGVVHEANGVKVTAFFVDHGPVKPAFGYRVDYHGHSVVISGDTKPSESLVKFSQNVDVLIHELGPSKQAPVLTGSPDELIPNSRLTRRQARTIADHHTDGAEAGHVFERVRPKLAVFSHFPNIVPAETLRLVRETYSGPVEFGEDLMTIEIGSAVNIRRFAPSNKQ